MGGYSGFFVFAVFSCLFCFLVGVRGVVVSGFGFVFGFYGFFSAGRVKLGSL